MKIRDAKKQASRARVVEAARSLFGELGFQETTVRMIADRAGLSPGGVFTTFEDKVAILCQILADERDGLFAEIEALIPTLTGPVRERIHAVVALARRHELPRLKMVLAQIGASYGWSRELEDEQRLTHQGLAAVLRRLVEDGVARGEIRADVDPQLMVEMLSAAYLGDYRTAYYAGLGAEELDGRMGRQLDLVFEGARPR